MKQYLVMYRVESSGEYMIYSKWDTIHDAMEDLYKLKKLLPRHEIGIYSKEW